MKLANSSNNSSGRVEIYHPSFGWGTVSDWFWDDTESDVVCRQLGFKGVKKTRARANYGKGSGAILLDLVRCTGKEAYIWECRHLGWNPKYCTHHRDVSVECY